jgi:SPP1 family predicted phage head-tail adaptor
MRFDIVIELFDLDTETIVNGFPSYKVLRNKTVLAKKSSVRSNEFYSAAQSGYNLEIMFEVYSLEYDAHNFIDYNSRRYKIVRTYDKGKITELICQAHSASP